MAVAPDAGAYSSAGYAQPDLSTRPGSYGEPLPPSFPPSNGSTNLHYPHMPPIEEQQRYRAESSEHHPPSPVFHFPRPSDWDRERGLGFFMRTAPPDTPEYVDPSFSQGYGGGYGSHERVRREEPEPEPLPLPLPRPRRNSIVDLIMGEQGQQQSLGWVDEPGYGNGNEGMVLGEVDVDAFGELVDEDAPGEFVDEY